MFRCGDSVVIAVAPVAALEGRQFSELIPIDLLLVSLFVNKGEKTAQSDAAFRPL